MLLIYKSIYKSNVYTNSKYIILYKQRINLLVHTKVYFKTYRSLVLRK